MFSEYRHKDYVTPRSIKQAYGHDDTYEPEIRCISETWGDPYSRPLLPIAIVAFGLFAMVWIVVDALVN